MRVKSDRKAFYVGTNEHFIYINSICQLSGYGLNENLTGIM